MGWLVINSCETVKLAPTLDQQQSVKNPGRDRDGLAVAKKESNLRGHMKRTEILVALSPLGIFLEVLRKFDAARRIFEPSQA